VTSFIGLGSVTCQFSSCCSIWMIEDAMSTNGGGVLTPRLHPYKDSMTLYKIRYKVLFSPMIQPLDICRGSPVPIA
jgi:hypothetical protein